MHVTRRPASRLLLLFLSVLLLVPAAACRGQEGREAGAAARADSVVRADSLAQADSIARVDSLRRVAAMTDGDAVAWPPLRVEARVAEDSVWAEALRIHYNALVLDGHVDVPMHVADDGYRIGQRHTARRSHVDLPRMTEGGLDGAFFAAYVAPYYGEGGRAVRRARTLIEATRGEVEANESRAGLATSAAEVRALAEEGRHAILLGLEGGHALAASPDTLRALAREGIRYVTLTHVNTNRWADSSQDAPRHGGLTDLGREMVHVMNEEGVMADLAHVSDSTFYDAVRASRRPVIVSHSSCRHLTPTVRNVSDEQLRAVARTGGVVMINFFDAMVNPRLDAELFAEAHRRLRAQGRGMAYLWSAVYALRRERGVEPATWRDVVDHIDHAVQVAGVDHVGLGSDFDGVFDLPEGFQDVARLPYVTYGLLKRGYSETEIYKILGGNLLCVMEAHERGSETAESGDRAE